MICSSVPKSECVPFFCENPEIQNPKISISYALCGPGKRGTTYVDLYRLKEKLGDLSIRGQVVVRSPVSRKSAKSTPSKITPILKTFLALRSGCPFFLCAHDDCSQWGGHPDCLQPNNPRPPSATRHLFLGEKNIAHELPRTPPRADLTWLKPREGHQHQTD